MNNTTQKQDLTYSERLQAALDSEARESATYDAKGGQKSFEAATGQCCDDPWKLNHYR